MKLTSNIAGVVTGGASGLGAATVRALTAKGVRVAIFDLDAKAGAALAEETDAAFVECDVTSEASADAAFAKARSAQGQERLLVNCAGTGGFKPLLSNGKAHSTEDFDRIVQLNLVGTFRCITRAALGMSSVEPVTDDGERGVIVNTASQAGTDASAGLAAYGASKAGVIGLTLPVARELSAIGVRVNAIAPGPYDTPLFRTVPEEQIAEMTSRVLFPHRLGDPAEFGLLVCQICENPALNGHVLRLHAENR